MNSQPLKILLIEDEIPFARWLEEILTDEDIIDFQITHVQRLTEALELLEQASFDVVLLDLSLPDSQGLESIVQVKQMTSLIPIIVLTGRNDHGLALAALRQGVQDYLIKGKFTGELLTSSIRYAIERQKTEVALRQQAMMKTMLDRIRKSLDLQEILCSTVAEVQKFLKTDNVSISKYCADGSVEVIAQAKRDRLKELNPDILFPIDLELFIQQSLQKSTIAINNTKDTSAKSLTIDSSIGSILTIAIWRNTTLEEQFVPIYFDDTTTTSTTTENPKIIKNADSERLWGLLVAYNYEHPRQWQSWETDFVAQLTTQVSIAIQQSELYRQLKLANRELERLAILDGLTGVANRRYFDRVLEKEWQRLAREQKPLALMLCDIDYFKLYNDTYGHPAGDLALQTVAQVLHSAIRRPADLVARYGGEEFALILPDTNLDGALYVGNLIRHNLAQLELAHQKSTVSSYVTLSVGLVNCIPNSKSSPQDLIEQADSLLYRAKRAGRNRIFTIEDVSDNSITL